MCLLPTSSGLDQPTRGKNPKISHKIGFFSQIIWEQKEEGGIKNWRKILDAKKTQSCITRNINDARDHRNNCEFVDRRNKVEVVTTQPIRSGGEVFADYGPTYWGAVDGAKGAKRAKGAKGAKSVKAVKHGAPVGGVRLKGGSFRPVAVKGGPRVKAVKTSVRLKGGAFRPMAVKRGARV